MYVGHIVELGAVRVGPSCGRTAARGNTVAVLRSLGLFDQKTDMCASLTEEC